MQTNRNSTRRSLLVSATALILSIAMLVGTTFAWFTDSASTGVNKIQAGNLDIKLEMKNATNEWVDAEGKTLAWKKASGTPSGEATLWEPGVTYELPLLKIKNLGNLETQFQVQINGITGKDKNGNPSTKLLDALNFEVVFLTSEEYFDDEELASHFTTEVRGSSLENLPYTIARPPLFIQEEPDLTGIRLRKKDDGGDTYFVRIRAHMDESANNDYQGLSLENIGITVVATQCPAEHDSFNDQYDKDAEYPIVANTQAELNAAIASAQVDSDISTEVVLPAGNFKLENGTAQNKNITISGTENTVVTVVGDTGNQMNYQNGATLAFEGVTIQGQTAGDFGGIAHVAKTTFVNCKFNGKLTLYGDATFINCTFINSNDYAIWTWGAKNAEFVGCTFDSGGKALLLYGGAGSTETPTTNLTVTDCVFNDDDTLQTAKKAAIEIGNDYDAVYNLTVKNINVSGFAVNPDGISTGSNIWANKDSMDRAHLNVVIDGADVY